jgi:hypothetical protein
MTPGQRPGYRTDRAAWSEETGGLPPRSAMPFAQATGGT